MVIAHSIFVVRTQQISCDIPRNFVCRGENGKKEVGGAVDNLAGPVKTHKVPSRLDLNTDPQ